jgi:hypothetical protein
MLREGKRMEKEWAAGALFTRSRINVPRVRGRVSIPNPIVPNLVSDSVSRPMNRKLGTGHRSSVRRRLSPASASAHGSALLIFLLPDAGSSEKISICLCPNARAIVQSSGTTSCASPPPPTGSFAADGREKERKREKLQD